ncbi:MAG: alanine--tRNA ligase [Dehalococcoidales bacterium]|nr:alanine--tRNA ligase [Dehalococcoidales bacterium]
MGELLTGDEIREAFLKFFAGKGHKVMPSASLIPSGDPTLLLTSAGMVPFKPYYLGEEIPPNRRLASCQKCFRTTDIEAVGDPHHLTFFEMLGNFSIGDYFKKEAISWAWEFVTRSLGIEPARLWITIFHDDEESFGYWREIGIPEDRIIRLGEKDNFWGPAGNSGPCGPCSEIHYDLGPEFGCRRPECAPGCDCGRFSEIWNLVFTQYNQDESGQRTLLPKPNIDTGMGLERTAAAMQGKSSVYETDLFLPLLDCISALAGKRYGADDETDNAMRIVAEHGRGITFLSADGVLPGNEGRGYVLRRLLRRAVLFSRRLAEGKSFLTEVAQTTIKEMGHVYPEIKQKEDFILRVIESEETRFSETLSIGLKLLDEIMEKARHRKLAQISGKEVFKLYDTYGFPVELTTEVVSRSGLSVDLAGFEKEMAGQRERARAAHKFEGKGEVRVGEQLDIKETDFVGYDNLKCQAKIINILVDGKSVTTVEAGQEASLVLDATPFYAEMGGQVGDTGEIIGKKGRFLVTNSIYGPQDVVLHQGKVTEGSLTTEDEIEAVVDCERRLDIARNHTATHLLHMALRQVLGEHVEQRGSLVAPERLRFDFSHLEALTREELNKVNHLVNDKIRRNLPVSGQPTTYQQAVAEGAIALFGEKYGDEVRVVKIGGKTAVSAELCGGTHVATTGEIGLFQITGEGSIGSGLRRIEAVTGRGAEEFIDAQTDSLHNIAESFKASPSEVQDKVSELAAELEKERRRALALERELSQRVVASLLGQVEVVNGVKVLAARVPSYRLETLRETSDQLREQLKSAVIVLGTIHNHKPMFLAAVTPDLADRGYHAGEIVNQVAGVTGGRGGGKARFAQAGGKHQDKLDEALRQVKNFIQGGG